MPLASLNTMRESGCARLKRRGGLVYTGPLLSSGSTTMRNEPGFASNGTNPVAQEPEQGILVSARAWARVDAVGTMAAHQLDRAHPRDVRGSPRL